MGYTKPARTITKMNLKCLKTSLKNNFVLTNEFVTVESDEAEHSSEKHSITSDVLHCVLILLKHLLRQTWIGKISVLVVGSPEIYLP